MLSRRSFVFSLAGGSIFAAMMPAWAKARSSGVIRMFDTDNDGTVDLAEAKAAASKLFDKLERDKDGTLDKRELAGRCWAKKRLAAHPDPAGPRHKGRSFVLG